MLAEDAIQAAIKDYKTKKADAADTNWYWLPVESGPDYYLIDWYLQEVNSQTH